MIKNLIKLIGYLNQKGFKKEASYISALGGFRVVTDDEDYADDKDGDLSDEELERMYLVMIQIQKSLMKMIMSCLKI